MDWIKRAAIIMSIFGARAALACSVCATGKEEARYAYYSTTALLSLLPLCMIGGIVFYIIKKSR